jgi:hypothetical protein
VIVTGAEVIWRLAKTFAWSTKENAPGAGNDCAEAAVATDASNDAPVTSSHGNAAERKHSKAIMTTQVLSPDRVRSERRSGFLLAAAASFDSGSLQDVRGKCPRDQSYSI